jgi:GTPase SAR1 family protein
MKADKEYIAFLGNKGVGKYSFILTLHQIDYANTDSTSGNDDTKFGSDVDDYYFKLDDKSDVFIFRLEDTFLDEILGKFCLKQCSLIALFYDITNQSSFDSLDKYIEIIKANCSPPPEHIILVGTHADQTKNRKVDKTIAEIHAETFANKIFGKDHNNTISVIEVNAKVPSSINKFKHLIFKKLNKLHTYYHNKLSTKKLDEQNSYSHCRLFLPIITALSGGAGGGVGGYYSGHLAIHHDEKFIIIFFTIIGSIIFGGLFGTVGYIASHSHTQDEDERQTVAPCY